MAKLLQNENQEEILVSPLSNWRGDNNDSSLLMSRKDQSRLSSNLQAEGEQTKLGRETITNSFMAR